MEIRHRVAFNADAKPDFKAALDKIEVDYETSPLPGHDTGLVHFDIAESDARWEQIAELVETRGASDTVQTVFTNNELADAEWVRLVPVRDQGYPQPEGAWVKNPINYREHCPQCGTFRQEASFRLKKEPRLGKTDFVSLFWTYALFCTPRVLTELETHGIQGYEVWDAIIHRTNTPSRQVSQLFIPNIADNGLVRVEDLKRETCPLCHTTKYYPHVRGVMYLRQDAPVPGVDIMQTREWFGSGHAAYREILVSNRFARLIIDQGWQGVTLKVVELV